VVAGWVVAIMIRMPVAGNPTQTLEVAPFFPSTHPAPLSLRPISSGVLANSGLKVAFSGICTSGGRGGSGSAPGMLAMRAGWQQDDGVKATWPPGQSHSSPVARQPLCLASTIWPSRSHARRTTPGIRMLRVVSWPTKSLAAIPSALGWRCGSFHGR